MKEREPLLGDVVVASDNERFVVVLLFGGTVKGYVVRGASRMGNSSAKMPVVSSGAPDAFAVHDLRGLALSDGTPMLDHDGKHCEDVGCERMADGRCGRFAEVETKGTQR